jgi:hypothetical protein
MNTQFPRTIRSRALGALIGAGLGLAALPAQALEVTGSFTGWWGQPEQQNHGLIIAVSRLPSGEKTGVVYWAHFDDLGQPSWLFGQGDIEDDRIDATLYGFDGITFMQTEDPDANFGEVVGSMEVEFADCLSGTVAFETDALGTGTFPIERLTNQPGTACTGGLSDDFRPDDLPQEFDLALASTGVIPDAEGHAEFEFRPGRAEFEIEIEDVTPGDYDVAVGGEVEGTISVADGESDGEIEFRSPQTPGKELLDFDPRDRIIDVLLDGEVVLTALAPAEGEPVGNGPPPFDDDDMETSEIELELSNTGVYPEGEAEAEFETDGERSEFEVEIEDIPAGDYPLLVGGTERGVITVSERGDGATRGEIEFRFPTADDEVALDFDPRGETVEIVEGATVLFTGDFPSEPGRDDDEDDRGGGNGSGPPHDDDDEDDRGDGPPDDDDSVTEISTALTNAGVYPDGSAEAEYEARGERAEFSVEVEDVPAGSYALLVGGVERGIIDVFEDDGDTGGEIEFETPADPDDELLDFDPRGQAVEILEGETLLFSVDFPG